MERTTWLDILRQQRAIAIIRAPTVAIGLQMAAAAMAGGFRLIEIAWTSDRPTTLVSRLREQAFPDCWVGVGTVLSADDLQEAIAAGAQFCFMPHIDTTLLKRGQTQAIPMMPGALTPTEIVTAWQLGACGVKVFPCQAVGGPTYIQHLQGPLGDIPLIPTGGVTIESGRVYLTHGAIAIGIASNLFLPQLVAQRNWEAIKVRSQTFLQSLG